MIDPKMIQQMQKNMASKFDEMQEEMSRVRVEGAAGGGVVKITLDGNQKCVGVSIQPEAIDPDDPEMLEDLMTAAFNAAVDKSKDANNEGMSKITGGLKIPGLM